MKNSNRFFIVIFLAFFAGKSFGQVDTSQQQLPQDSTSQGWYQQNNSIVDALTYVYFKNRDTGWATAGKLTIATTNGGTNWQTYTSGLGVISFIDSFGYATSTNGTGWLATTTDNGLTWNQDSTGFDFATNFYFCSPKRGYCVEQTNGSERIGRTLDGGKTWTADTTHVGDIISFASFDSLHVIAGGRNYTNPDPPHHFIASVFNTSDGGDSWIFSTISRLNIQTLQPVVTFDSATVYFIGGERGLYQSHNKGYTIDTFGIAFPSLSLCATGMNNITTVGEGGQIYRSYDAGKTWVKQNSTTTVDLYGVYFIDSTTGWAVGESTVLHTENGGYSWVKQQLPIPLEVKVTPEPFTTKTTLSYSIPKASAVNIKIYDMTGKEMYHVESDGIQSEGQHSIELSGVSLSAGVYYFLLIAGGFTGMGKLTKIVP